MKWTLFLSFGLFFMVFLSACVEKEPSVARVYVQDGVGKLLSNVEVKLISNSPTTPYFSHRRNTNEAGFVDFNIQSVFDRMESSKGQTAEFKIVLLSENDVLQTYGKIIARENIRATETIIFAN